MDPYRPEEAFGFIEFYLLFADMALCECFEFLCDSLCGFVIVES
mgnify:FL=1